MDFKMNMKESLLREIDYLIQNEKASLKLHGKYISDFGIHIKSFAESDEDSYKCNQEAGLDYAKQIIQITERVETLNRQKQIINSLYNQQERKLQDIELREKFGYQLGKD